jgi:NDP-4-keto-2,6-dideoxyhexose 3-C-methyltransferase
MFRQHAKGSAILANLYEAVTRCRICGEERFSNVISLGPQALSGAFPRATDADPPQAPLTVLRCTRCNLTQLQHSVDTSRLYTSGYGYRSGINETMRRHLASVVDHIADLVPLKEGDVVVDIGCNDGTLLNRYSRDLVRVGIDPLMDKFKKFYTDDVLTKSAFFSRDALVSLIGGRKASVVTSIAMFYDLEDPSSFVADVAASLDQNGIWIVELSYLPSMFQQNSYDTICHEHLEYYGLAQIEWMAERNNLKVFDVELNNINGGSFRAFLCPRGATAREPSQRLIALRNSEAALMLDQQTPYDDFRKRCERLRDELAALIRSEVAAGRRIHAYGASTKGNTILQYCGLDSTLIEAAADRNPEKWGARTPATGISIVSEEASRAMKPDYYLALPWHFRDEFLSREAAFLAGGGKFIFPIPKIEII